MSVKTSSLRILLPQAIAATASSKGSIHWIDHGFYRRTPLVPCKTFIMAVVGRLTKYNHFMILSHPFSVYKIAYVFLDTIYKLHGSPNIITSDKGMVFISKFWQDLFKLYGVCLQISTLYHPQIDNQTKLVNRCLNITWGVWLETSHIHGFSDYC